MLSTTNSSVTYVSDGSTLVYPTTFQFYDNTHLVVTYGTIGTENTLTLGVGYTVTAHPDPQPGTGTITLTAPVTAAQKIVVKRLVPLTQLVDLLQSGPFQADVIERMADLLAMICQQINDGSAVASSFTHGNLASAPDGTYHGDAVAGGNSGFLSGATKQTYDTHVASTSNPHATTAAQVSAAPSTHVGSTDVVLGHPLATTSLPGFMSAADKALMATISSNDPRTWFRDQFDGTNLNTDVWSKRESAAAGTYLSLTGDGDEQGILEITTAGVASNDAGIYLLARGPFTTRNPDWFCRAAQVTKSGCQTRWGICNDFSSGAPTHYADFYWDGGTFFARCAGGAAPTATGISSITDAVYAEYEIRVVSGGTVFGFFVNGVSVATITTNLPSTSKGLQSFFTINPTGGAAKKIRVDYCYESFTRAYT